MEGFSIFKAFLRNFYHQMDKIEGVESKGAASNQVVGGSNPSGGALYVAVRDKKTPIYRGFFLFYNRLNIV
jgi:hypothetical protein